MAFCFSDNLLRANFNIVVFLFYIVIVRGKLISFSSLLYFYTVEHCCPYFVGGDMQIWSID